MDLKKLAGTLLSSDSISGLSELTGASGSDITSVLAQALPALLNGANEQVKSKSTSKSFATALSQHAKDDTNNLAGFIGNVDLEDGLKIITHLLGSDKDNVFKNISKETGVSQSKITSILSAIAPLLMSLLGQQTDEDKQKDDNSAIEDLIGAVLDNVDVGDLLTGLLTDHSSSSKKSTKKTSSKKTTTTKSTTKKTGTKKKAASESNTGELIAGILKGLLK